MARRKKKDALLDEHSLQPNCELHLIEQPIEMEIELDMEFLLLERDNCQ